MNADCTPTTAAIGQSLQGITEAECGRERMDAQRERDRKTRQREIGREQWRKIKRTS